MKTKNDENYGNEDYYENHKGYEPAENEHAEICVLTDKNVEMKYIMNKMNIKI